MVNSAFNRFARTSTLRRDHRSKNTPANGPMMEYGKSRIANAEATVTALG